MNIIEALNAALPELPTHVSKRGFPKLDLRIIAKEHVEKGARVILAKLPGSENYIRLVPEQWHLLQLFDGQRSYAEVAAQVQTDTGIAYTEENVRDFAGFLTANADVFYKTELEKNITLSQKLRSSRLKRTRFQFKDVADIPLSQWNNADAFISKIHPYLKWIYTPWCTILTLALFGVMAWMWGDRWHEIWYDSFQFYNFSAKSVRELLEFWFLFGAMAFVHESAHGLTCKHYGANVEKMGFMLMYLAPTFYCDVTQIWIVGGRFERLVTVLAGIWADLILCAFATFLWWGTASGMPIHDYAYKVMMVTGIGVTILNLNPLIKLDGYYMFSEITGETDLKERSTLFLSSWLRNRIYRLPVEVEYLPQRRRWFYIMYGILSGTYGYVLITIVVIFTYHVFRAHTPEWAFIPAGVVAFAVYQSRLRTLGRFLRVLYLDKKDRALAWFTPKRVALTAACVVIFAFLPIWPDRIEGQFVLEPLNHAVINAKVAGRVIAVHVREGETLQAGDPVMELRNLTVESEAAQARTDLLAASARALRDQISNANYGGSLHEKQRAEEVSRQLQSRLAETRIESPIDGMMITPRVEELDGSFVAAGDRLAEIADTSQMLARIYVPEYAMHDVRVGESVRLLPAGFIRPLGGTITSLSPQNSPIASDLVKKDQLEGVHIPRFYIANVQLSNEHGLRDQMKGNAKIFVARRSLASLAGKFTGDLVGRRVW